MVYFRTEAAAYTTAPRSMKRGPQERSELHRPCRWAARPTAGDHAVLHRGCDVDLPAAPPELPIGSYRTMEIRTGALT